jgi:hypothetical protein
MHDGDFHAVRRFRALHVAGLAVNLALLAAAIWAIRQITL